MAKASGDEARQVRALIKTHGIRGAASALQLHHSAVTNLAQRRPVLALTLDAARVRLRALARQKGD